MSSFPVYIGVMVWILEYFSKALFEFSNRYSGLTDIIKCWFK